jgi:hypothetical protein
MRSNYHSYRAFLTAENTAAIPAFKRRMYEMNPGNEETE